METERRQRYGGELPEGLTGPARVLTHQLGDDGTYPNNALLPVVLYKAAFELDARDPAQAFEAVFAHNGWGHGWRDGLFGFHHYHSTAHEVLGCYAGHARVQLGGPDGPVAELEAGDCLIIPAGVAHRNIEDSGEFRVVGHYPEGQDFDMMYGRPGERPQADDNIARVPLPEADPVYGAGAGAIIEYWLRGARPRSG